jgi:hypothetical protein
LAAGAGIYIPLPIPVRNASAEHARFRVALLTRSGPTDWARACSKQLRYIDAMKILLTDGYPTRSAARRAYQQACCTR